MPNPSVAQTAPAATWTTGTTFTIAFSSATTAGDGIVANILLNNNGAGSINVVSITDDASTPNTYAKVIGGVDPDDLGGEFWQSTNANPLSCQHLTVTLSTTFVSGASAVGQATEIANGNNASLVDTSSFSDDDSSNSLNSGLTGTLSQTNELAIGMIGVAAGSGSILSSLTFTQGSPSTALPSATTVTNDSNNSMGINTSYLSITSTTPQALSVTYSGGIVAFFAGIVVIAPTTYLGGAPGPNISGVPGDPFAGLLQLGAPVGARPTVPSGNFTQAFTATLSFAGSLTKQTGNVLSAALSFAGSLTKKTSNALTSAALSFAGSLSNLHQHFQTLSATLGFAGTLVKQTQVPLAATLSFAGSLAKKTYSALTSTLSFAGSLTKQTVRTLTGAVLSFTGSLTKQTQIPLAAMLSFAGTVQRVISFTLSGVLSFTGSLTKQTRTTLSGVLSFVGSVTSASFFSQVLSATLSFAGSLVKQTQIPLLASISFAGTFMKQMERAFAAVLSFVGSLTSTSIFYQVLSAVLNFAGSLTKQTNVVLSAVASFAGSMNRMITVSMNAVVSFAGSVVKRTSINLSGALSFVGSIAKQAQLPLSGVLNFTGSMARKTTAAVTAVLSFAGSLTKKTATSFAGVLSFVGSLSYAETFGVALSAVLSFAGTQTKMVGAGLQATLNFAGSISKKIYTALAATVSFVGDLVAQIISPTGDIIWTVATFAHTIWEAASTALAWISGNATAIWTPTETSSWTAGVGHSVWTVTEGSLVPTSVSSLATDYIYVQISATLPDGNTINPTGDVVLFAFLGYQASPTSSTTWYTGSWALGTPYTAQCLVGPSGVVTLSPSSTPYTVWVKVEDDPETPILFAGRLQVS